MRDDSSSSAILARSLFVGVVLVISFASLSPSGWVPRVLYSYHLEHFAAFYLVGLSMAAARSRVGVSRVFLDVALLASLLEGARLFNPSRQLYVAEDWIADLGGALAALAPMVIAEFRRSFARPVKAELEPPAPGA